MPEPMRAEPSFEVLAKAVDDAAAEVAKLDEGPRKAAGELRAAIEAVHKAGLVTIVRSLRGDAAGRALLYELADDPLIRMIFSLHGIIRTGMPPGVGAAGEHAGSPRTGREHAGRQAPDGGCGCGNQRGGAQQAGPALIPLSAVRRRGTRDILPGGTA